MTLEYRCSNCGTVLQTTNADPLDAELNHMRGTLRYILAQAKAGHPSALAVIAANAESALGGLQSKVREMLNASRDT